MSIIILIIFIEAGFSNPISPRPCPNIGETISNFENRSGIKLEIMEYNTSRKIYEYRGNHLNTVRVITDSEEKVIEVKIFE